MSPSRSYLSADDERPLPPLPPTNDVAQSGQQVPSAHNVPPVTPSSTAPIVLSGPLPPGFVMSSFTPAAQTTPMPPLDSGVHTNPMTPAGFPLPPSIYSGTPSVVSTAFPPVVPKAENVVIPSIYSGSHTPGSQSKDPYSRPRVNHASDSDESSGASFDSPVTTRQKKTPKQPMYAAAPVPENVIYPMPPRPQSTTSSGSRGTRAARVPLPPSTLGTSSPASTVANIYARPSYSRSSTGFDPARSPSARTAPLSPLTGTGFPEPLGLPVLPPPPPMMIPPPAGIPVIPYVERRQS